MVIKQSVGGVSRDLIGFKEVRVESSVPKPGDLLVLRGGSWIFSARDARCAVRDGSNPDSYYGDVGFRVVVSLASEH